MISASSLSFFGFAAAVIILQRLAPGRLRAGLIFPLANVCFLLMAMPSPKALGLLAGFLMLSYAAIWVAGQRRRPSFVCAVVAVLGCFAWIKGYPFLASLSPLGALPVVVGLSYILIRSIQVAVDVYEGTLPQLPSPWGFFNFLCAWPMLLSGPIQSYQSFSQQIAALPDSRLSAEVTTQAVARIVWGLFSVIVVADIALGIYTKAHEAALRGYAGLSIPLLLDLPQAFVEQHSIGRLLFVPKVFGQLLSGKGAAHTPMLALAQLAYLVYLYFNFSGYTHIVIAVGRLAGLDIPENFNRPWASNSFLDLWTRWHMTLANWFRTYVFNRIVHKLLKTWPSKAWTPYYAVFAFFVTFFLVGVWHGPTWPYFLCGLSLGLGVSINKLWQIQLAKALGRKGYTNLASSTAYQALCGALAMAYLSITITPFWASKDEIVKMAFGFGAFGQTTSLLLMTVIITPVSALCQAGERRASGVGAFISNPYVIGLTSALTAIYLFLTPDVNVRAVYQGF